MKGNSPMKSYLFLITAFMLILLASACAPAEIPTATQTPTIVSIPTLAPTPTPIGGGTGQIVFSSYREGESEIFIMSGDGSIVTRLTEDTERVNRPACSPDGKHIAYVRQEGSTNVEIYVMNADGSDPFRLTYNLNTDDTEPDWSPDGSSIAFASTKYNNFDILTINLENFQQTRLTENPGADMSPDWSPDGGRIVFQSDRDGNNEIYAMNADGSGKVNLTNHGANDTDPAWSPDGGLIAFVSDRDGDDDIYVMNADGSDPIRLTDSERMDSHPTWSPDGNLIAFYSNRVGSFEIYVMNADGSNQTSITHHEEFDGFPAWQPRLSTIETVALHPPYTLDREITEWLKENTIEIFYTPLEDIWERIELMGFYDDALVVAAGGATYGSREIFEMRDNVTGNRRTSAFNNWMISMDWNESVILNEFLHTTGSGDSRELLLDLDYWFWRTRGMRNVLNNVQFDNNRFGEYTKNQWLEWRMVSIYGFLNLPPSLPMDHVVEFLQSVDPNTARVADSRYECIRNFEPDWDLYADLPIDNKNRCAEDLQQVYDDLSGHQEEYEEASSSHEIAFALLSAEYVVHLEEQYRIEDPELQNQVETRNAAEGIRWLRERSGSNAKMVLWTSSHVIADLGEEAVSGTPSSVGAYLRDFYGEEMLTVGITFYAGEVNARSYDSGNPVIVQQVHPPPANSFEWIAHQIGIPAFLLDLRGIDLDDPGAAWLDQPLYMHCIGEYYDPASPEDYLCEYHLPTAFDAIIFVDQVTPLRFLPGVISD
jgi:Tol biopolymer transport system component/erythromycin esterase-like protein